MDEILQQVQNIGIEPSSTGWFDLPLKMREMVIDRMDAKTRCRFAQCSKVCEEEAKKSSKYFHTIKVEDGFNMLKLKLMHGEKYDESYDLEFIDAQHGDTTVVYRSASSRKTDEKFERVNYPAKWMKLESGMPRYVRAKYVKKYFEQYKNSIMFFWFAGNHSTLGDFNLDNLRKLCFINFYNVPIEYGNVSELENIGFIKIKKLLQIGRISMTRAKFTFDQIVQFKGKQAFIASDEFDEENIKKYLKMWKNGEIHENVECVQIQVGGPVDFILRNITEELDVLDYVEYTEDDITQCSFYSKCKFGENKIFRVEYEPYCHLQVSWERFAYENGVLQSED